MTTTVLDVRRVRRDFPALHQEVHGRPLVYLDSAATALKPQPVIDAVTAYYARDCANVHRGVHMLSQRATAAFERVRDTVAAFVHAPSSDEIVFVRGTTEAINLVAWSWARPTLRSGDEILITGLEHHSNIVPWQMVCEATGARLVVAPMDEAGDVPLAAVDAALSARTRLVAVSHASNALGTILPVADIARLAHARGARVLVDGAQAAPHLPVDVQALGCDFYAFSGHKLYGPTGAGALWARGELLRAMPPYQGGGGMIRSVTFQGSLYADAPNRFEAGTPSIAEVIGMGAAIDYLRALGMDAVAAHERRLLDMATRRLAAIPGLRIRGTAAHKIGVISFTLDDAHPHDIGTILDVHGVAIRSGHHCAQPIMDRLGVPATARASLGLYNHDDDIDALVRAIQAVKETFA